MMSSRHWAERRLSLNASTRRARLTRTFATSCAYSASRPSCARLTSPMTGTSTTPSRRPKSRPTPRPATRTTNTPVASGDRVRAGESARAGVSVSMKDVQLYRPARAGSEALRGGFDLRAFHQLVEAHDQLPLRGPGDHVTN